MKKKNLVSLGVAAAFFILSVTGLLLYIKQKAEVIEMTHTVFGLLFIAVAIFHIVNNLGSLKNYTKDKKEGTWKKEFFWVGGLLIVLLIAAMTEMLEPIAEFGKLFAPKKEKKEQPNAVMFHEKTYAGDSTNGQHVVFLIQRDPSAARMQMTVNLADSTGKVTDSLVKPERGPAADLLLETHLPKSVPSQLQVTLSEREGGSKTYQFNISAPGAAGSIESLLKEQGLPFKRVQAEW